MSGRVLCTCGAVLVAEVTREGVRPVGSEEIVAFRRTTDWVMCPACLKTYEIRTLMKEAFPDMIF